MWSYIQNLQGANVGLNAWLQTEEGPEGKVIITKLYRYNEIGK